MKIYIAILLFIPLICCSNERDRAIKHSIQAFLKYPKVRTMRKNLEKTIIKTLPIDKPTLQIVLPTTIGLAQGKVDTKVIKKMDIKMMGGKLRPDLEYNFKQNIINTSVNIKWDF